MAIFLVLPAQPAVCVYGLVCVHRVIRCFSMLVNVSWCDAVPHILCLVLGARVAVGRLRPPPSSEGVGYTARLWLRSFPYGPSRARGTAAELELYPFIGGLAVPLGGRRSPHTGARRRAVWTSVFGFLGLRNTARRPRSHLCH
jgi:hypothetical protein